MPDVYNLCEHCQDNANISVIYKIISIIIGFAVDNTIEIISYSE